jgi:hypothetical protein
MFMPARLVMNMVFVFREAMMSMFLIASALQIGSQGAVAAGKQDVPDLDCRADAFRDGAHAPAIPYSRVLRLTKDSGLHGKQGNAGAWPMEGA